MDEQVFEALYSILTRDLRKAATLLMDCVATFSSTEICSYPQFMFYAIVTNLLTLPRIELKKKVSE